MTGEFYVDELNSLHRPAFKTTEQGYSFTYLVKPILTTHEKKVLFWAQDTTPSFSISKLHTSYKYGVE